MKSTLKFLRKKTWIKTPSTLDEDGGALIEFTIMAPMLFLMMFGIIEWGSLFWLQNNMVNATREGARTAATQLNTALTSSQVMTLANQTSCNWLSGSGQRYTIISADWCSGLNAGTQDLNVSISVDAAQASVFNYLGMFTGVTFKTATQMRKELNCAAPGVTVSCQCNGTVNPATGC